MTKNGSLTSGVGAWFNSQWLSLLLVFLLTALAEAQTSQEQLLVPSFSSQQVAVDGVPAGYQLRLVVRCVNTALNPSLRYQGQAIRVTPEVSFQDSSGATFIYTIKSSSSLPVGTLTLDNSLSWRPAFITVFSQVIPVALNASDTSLASVQAMFVQCCSSSSGSSWCSRQARLQSVSVGHKSYCNVLCLSNNAWLHFNRMLAHAGSTDRQAEWNEHACLPDNNRMQALASNATQLRISICSRAEWTCNTTGDIVAFTLLGDPRFSCSGQLPVGLSSLPGLQWLQISGANLNTSISSIISSLSASSTTSSLRHLILPDSNILGNASSAGSNPSMCAFAGQLSRFILSGNRLSGNAPDCWAHSNLTDMDLSYNPELGGMPVSDWAVAAPNLRVLDVSSTAVGGVLLSLPPAAVLVNISHSKLSGGVPPLPRTLRVLDLKYAALNDTIVDNGSWATSSLIYADIGNNVPGLSGELPDMPQTLLGLYVESNRLSGTLPPSLDQSTLVELNCSGNNLTGPLIGRNLASINVLDVSFNAFTGSLPVELARSSPYLVMLAASRNQLSGDLSAFINTVRPASNRLLWFDVANNAFTLSGTLQPLANFGMFTTQFAMVAVSRSIDLSNNQITAPLPQFMLTAVPQIASLCRCEMWVVLSGGANNIRCPAKTPLQDAALRTFRALGMTCTDPASGWLVEVVSALVAGPGAGMVVPRALENVTYAQLLSSVVPPLNGAGQLVLSTPTPAKKGMAWSWGAITVVVVGATTGGLFLVTCMYLVLAGVRGRRHRARAAARRAERVEQRRAREVAAAAAILSAAIGAHSRGVQAAAAASAEAVAAMEYAADTAARRAEEQQGDPQAAAAAAASTAGQRSVAAAAGTIGAGVPAAAADPVAASCSTHACVGGGAQAQGWSQEGDGAAAAEPLHAAEDGWHIALEAGTSEAAQHNLSSATSASSHQEQSNHAEGAAAACVLLPAGTSATASGIQHLTPAVLPTASTLLCTDECATGAASLPPAELLDLPSAESSKQAPAHTVS